MFFLVLALPLSGQTPTQAGTRIVNKVRGTFQVNALPLNARPDSVQFVVGQAGSISLINAQQVIAAPATTKVLAHVLRNSTNATESFRLRVVTSSNWTVKLYQDGNGNGELDAADVAISDVVELAADAELSLLVVVEVPATISADSAEQVVVSAVAVSNPALTATVTDSITVRAPQFTFSKTAIGAAHLFLNDSLSYRLVVRNTSHDDALRQVQVVDTMPAPLEVVAIAPGAAMFGRVITWTPSDVPPGDSAVLVVTARVAAPVSAHSDVENRAYATVAGGASSAAATVAIEAGEKVQLKIALSSQVLEAYQGDIVPFVAEVRNTGWFDLHDVVVELLLPPGTSYVPGSLAGADSILAIPGRRNATPFSGSASLLAGGLSIQDQWNERAGGRLLVRMPAALAAGSAARFRYSIAIVAAPTHELNNSSIAMANGQTVISNESSVILRVSRNNGAQTLTVIGSAFLDDNGNGRFDDGEKPAANVDVWSEDGAISRTDAQGKFSFHNLRSGAHAFRIDPATFPDGYALQDGEDGVTRVRLTGWTSPRVLLALVPRPAAAPMRAQPAAPAGDSIVPPRRAVTVAPARSTDDRAADVRRALLFGPGAQIFSPDDGMVSGQKRVFIGVHGEPNMPIALFRGDTLVEQGRLRVDGVYDFLGVPLRAGPNMMRVRMQNSWGKVRWDSVVVHMSGAPAQLVTPTRPLSLPADGQSEMEVRVRVLDAWGVPVLNRPFLTIAATGAVITTADAEPSSVGTQARVDDEGWLVVKLKAGVKISRGMLRVSSTKVNLELPIELTAPALPFMLIGTGEVSVGAGAAQNFAAITGRGRLDDRTSLTVSVDTRRVENSDGAFGRTVNPLSDTRYAITGDASEERIRSAARAAVSVRLERGLDYLAFGDVQTGATSEDVSLTRYMRSLTGAAGEVTRGRFKWSGFGALTSQALAQVQLRGRGTSGPYEFGQPLIAGTEQIYVEVRERDNPQHVKNRQALLPYIDYDVDYTSGRILLKNPLAASDISGNPLFLVVTSETAGQSERRSVVGGHVQADLSHVVNAQNNALLLGASMVRDGQSLDAVRLAGLDLTVAPRLGTKLHAEIAHSQAGDSSGVAALVDGSVQLAKDAVVLSGRWSRTGDGFGNPSNVALQTTTQDLQLSAGLRVLGGQLRIDHSEQNFATQNVERHRTSMSLRQPLVSHVDVEARVVRDDATGAQTRQAGAGEVKLTWAPSARVKVWGESRRELWAQGGSSVGDYLGGGLAVQAMRDVWVEARHLSLMPGEGKGYSLTNIGVRSNVMSGSQAWGSYQINAGVDGATSAALVGLNNRWTLGPGLKLNTLFERRMGVQRAPQDDPVRALPFPQQESDYWSGALGLEYLPQNKPYRLAAKTERKQGAQETSTAAALNGDIALGNSLALLARNEYVRRENAGMSGSMSSTLEHRMSIWGVALRPTRSDRINGLVEMRWVSDRNPALGQLVDRSGSNARMIGAAEVVWSPVRALELGARYALRQTRNTVSVLGLDDIVIRSKADYAAARSELTFTRALGVRAEVRALRERNTNQLVYDLAPALLLRPVQGIELAGGRRFGALRDPDFSVNGGSGWFMSMGIRLTESSLPTAAAFWRDRLGRNE